MFQLDNPTESQVIALLKEVLTHNPELFSSREDDLGCFMRALRLGEPTFTLRAQDVTSVGTIAAWLKENTQLSPERQRQTLDRIRQMDAWPMKKRAD